MPSLAELVKKYQSDPTFVHNVEPDTAQEHDAYLLANTLRKLDAIERTNGGTGEATETVDYQKLLKIIKEDLHVTD
jgi:hypothetical protein